MGGRRELRTQAWKRRRADWQARINNLGGVACWRCGELITPGQRWHLGHITDKALGGDESELAPEHPLCNQRAGGELAMALRDQRLNMVRVVAPPDEPDALFGVLAPRLPSPTIPIAKINTTRRARA